MMSQQMDGPRRRAMIIKWIGMMRLTLRLCASAAATPAKIIAPQRLRPSSIRSDRASRLVRSHPHPTDHHPHRQQQPQHQDQDVSSKRSPPLLCCAVCALCAQLEISSKRRPNHRSQNQPKTAHPLPRSQLLALLRSAGTRFIASQPHIEGATVRCL